MDDEDDEEPISIHERRRRAPLHFWSRANNARLSARVIWEASGADQTDLAASIGYNDTPNIALREAFLREASVALELIIKAVIAQRMELGISKLPAQKPANTHDLVRLWDEAELPNFTSRGDQYTLVIGKQVLQWAGRYQAPTKDEHYDQGVAEEEGLQDPLPGFSIKIIKSRSITWEQFDAVYVQAADALWQLRDDAGR